MSVNCSVKLDIDPIDGHDFDAILPSLFLCKRTLSTSNGPILNKPTYNRVWHFIAISFEMKFTDQFRRQIIRHASQNIAIT